MSTTRPDTAADPCAEPGTAGLLDVGEARRRILEAVRPVEGSVEVALGEAPGRVLAEAVAVPFDVPPADNSAMDGYALRAGDVPAEGEARLRVVGAAFAGHPFTGRVGPGEAVRIMTGAVLPEGADAVVMQERVRVEGDGVVVPGPVWPGENVRRAGEDLARGAEALAAGTRLGPAQIGLLASLGLARVAVRRRPRVAVFSTGDELRQPGEPLGPGDIYDSNRPTLLALLAGLGLEPLDLGRVPDERGAVEETLARAAREADAVLTSGGVSVGEADYVTEVLRALGEVGFWKVAIKPGKPLAFGRVDEALFFGLPGNPVSVMVTFLVLVQPALRRLAGERDVDPPVARARARAPFRKRPGRTDYQRGVLAVAADGTLEVAPTGPQGSHVLSSVARADCLVVLPREAGDIAPGTWVEVHPFRGLMPC